MWSRISRQFFRSFQDCVHLVYILEQNEVSSGYLDDLDAEGVVVRVAALVKGKTKRFLPVDGDTVEVLVCQCEPNLET